MHPVYLLAFVTFGLVIAFLVWNRLAITRSQKYGDKATGIGSPSDPMS